MNPNPDVSIIVPVYNVEAYLEECLDSIYKIEDCRFEVILVNDGSPDGCDLIIERFSKAYPEKTRVINKKNEGLSLARNSGLEVATGQYISFIDSDDFIVSSTFSKIVNTAIESGVDVVQGNAKAKWGQKLEFEKLLHTLPDDIKSTSGIHFFELFLDKGNKTVVWDKLYRTAFLKKYDIRFIPNIGHEDVPFNYYVFCHAESVEVTDVIFYSYRLREGSFMHSLDKKSANSRIQLVSLILNFLETLDINSSPLFDFLVYQLWRARKQSGVKDRSLAFRLLLKNTSVKKKIQSLIMVSF